MYTQVGVLYFFKNYSTKLKYRNFFRRGHIMRNQYSLYFLDIDGTLIKGKDLLPKTKTFIQQLRKEGKQIYYVTNHPVRCHDEHVEYLTKLGLSINKEELITPLDGLKRFFNKIDVPYCVYVAASSMVKQKLRDWDIPVIEGTDRQLDNCYVVLGMSSSLNYGILQEAYECIQKGATVLVLNPDRTCPSNDYKLLDTGLFLKLFEESGDLVEEPIIIGKPSVWMQEVLAEKINVPKHEVVIIGDTIASDIALGNALGIDSVFLTNTDIERNYETKTSTHVMSSIKELVERWC